MWLKNHSAKSLLELLIVEKKGNHQKHKQENKSYMHMRVSMCAHTHTHSELVVQAHFYLVGFQKSRIGEIDFLLGLFNEGNFERCK